MASWLGVYTELSERVANAWAHIVRSQPRMRAIELSPFAGTATTRFLSNTYDVPAQLEDDIVHHCIRWRAMGAPTFRLTHGLTAGLLLTDPARMPWSEVRLPFDSFVVSLPPGMIWFDDFDGKPVEATFATVHVFDAPDVSRERANAVLREMGYKALDSTIDDILALPTGKHLMLRLMSEGDGAKLHYMAPIPGPGEAQKTVQELFGYESDDGSLSSRDHAAQQAIARVIVGLSQYLASHTEQGTPVWTPRERPQGRSHGSRSWDIGRAVKVSREVRQAAVSYTREPGSEAWKVAVRHIVRGHMRGVWHGPKNDPSRREKRLQWVAPFWRGPEGGPVVQRLYDVEE